MVILVRGGRIRVFEWIRVVFVCFSIKILIVFCRIVRIEFFLLIILFLFVILKYGKKI